MTSESLDKFLKALEAVKNDYKCGVCAQYCKDPVTLSKCFHTICSAHFDELKSCPTCKTNLEGCTKFYDTGLSTCVNATKELDTYFQNYVKQLTCISDVNTIPNVMNVESDVSQIPNTTSENINNDENKFDKIESAKISSTKQNKQSFNLKINTSELTLRKKTTKQPEKNEDNKNKILSTRSKKPTLLLDTKIITKNKKTTSKSESTKKTQDKVARSKNQNILDTSNTEIHAVNNENECILNISSASSKFNKATEKRNQKGETLLHIACRLGKVERITELLQQGANTNTKDNAGWTPLHEVVQNGRLDLVRLLLQYNTLIDVPGQSNETPLHEAIRYKHEDIAVELVKHGADIHARNSKGETPFQLASIDFKTTLLAATEDIKQTQSLNVTNLSLMQAELDFDNIRVYCTSKDEKIHSKLKILAKAHFNLTIESKFNKKVSHLIVDTEDGVCKSTIDVLQAIVNSLWILSVDWITNSSEMKLESFVKYEVIGVENKHNNGPKKSRYNKYKQLPGIFDGCHFYFHGFNGKCEVTADLTLTKANLSKLITDAGGVILQRVPNPEAIPDEEKLVPYHARKDGKLAVCTHYIIFKEIYQPMYNMQHLKALPTGWLLECLEKYELCEPWTL